MIRNLLQIVILVFLFACGGSFFDERSDEGDVSWTPEIIRQEQTAVGQGPGANYLPDFSYAGYHWGETPIPEQIATMSVSDFGAVADDGIDDTAAFKRALDAAHKSKDPVVLKIPKGRFILNDILAIKRSDFTLQGAGSNEGGTVIQVDTPLSHLPLPESLKELEEYIKINNKRTDSGKLVSNYSWMGGVIWVQYPNLRVYPYLEKYDREIEAIAIAQAGIRGSHEITVNPGPLKVGDAIELNWFNLEGKNSTLLQHLFMSSGLEIGVNHWDSPQRPLINQELTITAIRGNVVTVKEPLLHDIRERWQVKITRPTLLREVGLENFAIEFPNTPYIEHHGEEGYNGIYFTGSTHSWIRNVRVHNADTSILTDKVSNLTITGVSVTGRQNHYGIHLGGVYNVLVKDTVVDTPSFHSLSFNTYARSSVYTNTEVLQTPSLDQHCGANHQNLFDNIKVTEDNKVSRLFQHGGAGYWKPTHGAYNTFWNIKVNFTYIAEGPNPIKIAGIADGPYARLIGVSGNYPLEFNYGPDAYIEGTNRPQIKIPSLYEFQLARRLQAKHRKL
ncbi:MAG: glycosyl hydrolase family 28-related protein [Oligoflexales bacterium]